MSYKNSIYEEDFKKISFKNESLINLDNKKILITGAAGLIGSSIVDFLLYRNEKLHSNITIYALGRNLEKLKSRFEKYLCCNKLIFITQDITQPMKLKERVDYIIHAASNAHPLAFAKDPVGTMNSNYFGIYNLLEYARLYNVEKLVYISSGEVYGQSINDIDVFNEAYSGYVDCTKVRACYPSSKRASETLCISYVNQYNVNVSIARPCHIYGANFTKEDSRAIAQFIRNICNKEDIIMKSLGEQIRSYCYINDCINAILTVLLRGENGEAYNIADSNSIISIKELAEIIAEIGNQKVRMDLPDDIEKIGYTPVMKSVLDSNKLQQLGWEALDDLKVGLKKTINILKSIEEEKNKCIK